MEIKTLVVKQDFIDGLKEGEIKSTDTICVHTSMSKFGWVCGGAQSIVEALLEVVNNGTIIMPSQTMDNSEPSNWQKPPVPKEWWPVIKEHMPAYNVELTETRGMGKVVSSFLGLDNVIRSSHPQVSFCGIGQKAEEILKDHNLDYGLYKNTPLDRLYHSDAKIVLLGVSYDNCTAMHYAECETKVRPINNQGAAMMENGERVWKVIKELDLDSDIFVEVGKLLEADNRVKIVKIKDGVVRVFSVKDAIDYAIKFFKDGIESGTYKVHEVDYD